jgi:protein-S-isoprenylcysteine O-methyltransferase Ste14
MSYAYRYLLPSMWIAWLLYWWALSFNVKTAARRESLLSQFLHVAPLAIALLLLFAPDILLGTPGERLLPAMSWSFWLGAVLTAGGLAFTVWARRCIGKNWSAIVTIKEGHEFVARGPYALVRHPIYTGLLLAFAGSALARDQWRGVLAVLLGLLAFWSKLRREERFMLEQFGDAYRRYRARVPALVPRLRRRLHPA